MSKDLKTKIGIVCVKKGSNYTSSEKELFKLKGTLGVYLLGNKKCYKFLNRNKILNELLSQDKYEIRVKDRMKKETYLENSCYYKMLIYLVNI